MTPIDVFLYALAAVAGLIAAPFIVALIGATFGLIAAAAIASGVWLVEWWERRK